MAAYVEGIVIISGAGSGIGAATACEFARHGASGISLVDIDQEALDEVRKTLQKHHPDLRIQAIQTDVTDNSSVHDAVQQTASEFGGIDIAINAAGVGDVGQPTHETSVSDWKRITEVNQLGTWLFERAILQQMLQQRYYNTRRGRGVIVNVASSLGLVPSATGWPCPSYVASKFAIVGLTKMDAKFYASRGVRINTICPGWVLTSMTRSAIESGVLRDEVSSAPIGRLAEMDEITKPILFLASPMSSFMYGSVLAVDGGYSL